MQNESLSTDCFFKIILDKQMVSFFIVETVKPNMHKVTRFCTHKKQMIPARVLLKFKICICYDMTDFVYAQHV